MRLFDGRGPTIGGTLAGMGFIGIVVASLITTATVGSAGSSQGFAALDGKRVPGTPKSWLPIANPYIHPKNVAGTDVPPVITGSFLGINFFHFSSTAKAKAFYADPPLAARMGEDGVLAYASLPGPTGVPAPSRGVDLRSCLFSTGGSAGGTMNAAGACSAGVPSSLGTATIAQRGKVVVIAQGPNQTSVTGGSANPSELTNNTAYMLAALKLMKQVGLTK